MTFDLDMHEKYAIVFILKGTNKKPKIVLMSVEDAKTVMAGKSKKFSPEMVEDINWNPTIGQIAWARSKGRGFKLHKEPGKSDKRTCAECGKKFEKYQTVRQEVLQEIPLGGPGALACKACAKKLGLL